LKKRKLATRSAVETTCLTGILHKKNRSRCQINDLLASKLKNQQCKFVTLPDTMGHFDKHRGNALATGEYAGNRKGRVFYAEPSVTGVRIIRHHWRSMTGAPQLGGIPLSPSCLVCLTGMAGEALSFTGRDRR
jgi:hypothetical protein